MTRAIFIDGGYLERLGIDLANLQYPRLSDLVDHVVEGQQDGLLRAYFYVPGHILDYPEFSDAVRANCSMNGIELRFAPSGCRADVMLAVDAMSIAARGVIDEVILVAGDGEFVSLVTTIKGMGLSAVLCHGPRGSAENETVNADLYGVSDVRRPLSMTVVASLEATA